MPTPIKVSGQRDWSAGCDSSKVPTIVSALNPNGLGLNALAWGVNLTARDGSLSPRDGFLKKGNVISAASLPYLLNSTYQGDFDYVPITGTPYKIYVIGGHVLKVDPDFVTPPIDLSEIYGLQFTYANGVFPKVYFAQGQQFLVIQAGDYNPENGNGQLPLFWNGSTLIQSNGITGITIRGAVSTTQYTLPVMSNFNINGTPGETQVIYVSGTYPGNLYDKITLAVSPTSLGPDSGVTIGVFEVTGFFSGYLQLKTISATGSGATYPIFPSTDTPLTLTLTIVSPNTQTVAVAFNQLGDVTSASPSTVPSGGTVITMNFSPGFGSAYLYPGKQGDVIHLFNGGTDLGTFLVQGFKVGQMQISGVNQLNVGHSLLGANLTWLALYNISTSQSYFLVPAAGQTISVPFAVFGSSPDQYIGSIGDTISIPSFGTYQVVGYGNYPPWNTGVSVILKAISPLNVDNVNVPFPINFTLTITAVSTQTGGTNLNQIPAALAMIYYMGRIWYATGATANAGDIIGGPSGTLAYNYQDSVLYVTENPLVLGGDGFTMPSGSDNITGFGIPQMINASLGQGLLNIGTANAVFALQVPVTRADWIAAGASDAPEIFVVQQSNGFANDWSVVGVNGDLWFQSLTPDIRSLLTAVRYFQQWGNVDVSSNENRILSQVNRTLLGWASGIYFNNYLLMTTLPIQTPFGVVHKALIPLDFEPISTLEEQLPPAWYGQQEGLQIFKLGTATFNSVQRGFATTLSTENTGQIELWEIVPESVGDNGSRIQWQVEFPSMTWYEHNMETQTKRLVSGEIWMDEIEGVVEVNVQYIPDGSSCLYDWYKFSVCSATDSSQLTPSEGYPLIQFQPGVRRPIILPLPPDADEAENSRPANVAFEFQPILTIKGQARLRGFFLKAEQVDRPTYEGLL